MNIATPAPLGSAASPSMPGTDAKGTALWVWGGGARRPPAVPVSVSTSPYLWLCSRHTAIPSPHTRRARGTAGDRGAARLRPHVVQAHSHTHAARDWLRHHGGRRLLRRLPHGGPRRRRRGAPSACRGRRAGLWRVAVPLTAARRRTRTCAGLELGRRQARSAWLRAARLRPAGQSRPLATPCAASHRCGALQAHAARHATTSCHRVSAERAACPTLLQATPRCIERPRGMERTRLVACGTRQVLSCASLALSSAVSLARSAAHTFEHACAGREHTLSAGVDGTLWAWGSGKRGQLGHGERQSCARPQRVRTAGEQLAQRICCGADHNVVATADGIVLTWGCGQHGQLGAARLASGCCAATLVSPTTVPPRRVCRPRQAD